MSKNEVFVKWVHAMSESKFVCLRCGDTQVKYEDIFTVHVWREWHHNIFLFYGRVRILVNYTPIINCILPGNYQVITR